MIKAAGKGDEPRHEHKFVVSDLTKQQVELLVKLHPAIFREKHEGRFVNNIYLDSPDMRNYVDSVDGVKDRVKFRIRWYGDLLGVIPEPTLELKTKNADVNQKKQYSLNSFLVDQSLSLNTVRAAMRKSELPEVLKLHVMSLEVVLMNRYRRKYFESANGRCRITLDSDMEFYQTRMRDNGVLVRSVDYVNTVVEIKYDREADEDQRWVASCFPFRLSRNSKYVSGIGRLNSW